MARKPNGLTRRAALLASAALCLCLTPTTHGQQPAAPVPPVPPAPASFDPSDIYFQGWLLSRDAEKLVEEGNSVEALEKLRRAKELFDAIARQFPDWKSDMVAGRREKTTASIAEVIPDALKDQKKTNQAIAELEGSPITGGVGPGGPPRRLESGMAEGVAPTREIETLDSRRIDELQAEVARLKQQIQATTDPNGAGREASRAADMSRQRDLARSQLKKAQDDLNQLQKRFAEAPMHDELRGLSQRIQGLEREKEVIARTLESSQAETREAKGQVAALQQERARLMQETADLKRNLDVERKTSNEVIDGQRKRLKHFQELLDQKDQQLAEANHRIESLQVELNEVRASLADVQQENEALLNERNQMAALLKLNEGSQLQALVDQNVGLSRELRESEKRYQALESDQQATQEELLGALRDLTITKLRIQAFRKEKDAQEKRMAQLEARLRSEEKALVGGNSDPAEIEALRGIIQRQLRIQDKRREARELLMGALAKKAEKDEEIDQAMALFQGAELNLSPDELRLIENHEVDGVIISPYARPRGEVARSVASLERELAPIENVGTKAYLNNRLHAAREAFEMILERHEGDTSTMCKLGLVELRLGDGVAAADMFRRATELDPTNPYAHRMLGHTLMESGGDSQEALAVLQRSVLLTPTHGEAHILLGNLQFRIGDTDAAEESFKTAIACDETSAEPHYNLAILCAREGRKTQGLEHYRKAIELGVPPNLSLEKSLATNTN